MTPADVPAPAEPGIVITVPWLATQLVPSPEVAYGQERARFGMRWQVTPLLYSWGIHRGLSPWRFFVAEPLVRQSGSIELFVTPEYFFYGSSIADGWGVRTGLRSYFPLVSHGEYLSFSAGTSSFLFAGKWGAAYEAGVYALFGILGLQLTVTPSAPPIATIATFRIRFF
ncbi:MAG TPA: hypothetical protein VGG39_05625 [Polyangiaceae bacterium]|jgi:hypothetical protein